ncbi:hypothetical protein GCM10008018_72700 [Paenibacillus marchantiophytorum]|uniref:Uncharacterized protein n=1 Tax=Paenibacillus marchantiophytorum TaxID=1619310 RepID=A0ABQ1FKE6_9BACL|nr:hypothetical protein [Paenibacillus marchantiophytorum]GGA18189.1 hypothetical protein GCM10008018_72700 [Paenibacillus marchantiophytorum]
MKKGLGKEIKMKSTINLLKVIAALVPSLILIFYLLHHFPNTGLGRIIAIPFIFVVNAILITIGLIFFHRFNNPALVSIWITIILLTLVITVLIYPQEYDPSVINQMWNMVFIRR